MPDQNSNAFVRTKAPAHNLPALSVVVAQRAEGDFSVSQRLGGMGPDAVAGRHRRSRVIEIVDHDYRSTDGGYIGIFERPHVNLACDTRGAGREADDSTDNSDFRPLTGAMDSQISRGAAVGRIPVVLRHGHQRSRGRFQFGIVVQNADGNVGVVADIYHRKCFVIWTPIDAAKRDISIHDLQELHLRR